MAQISRRSLKNKLWNSMWSRLVLCVGKSSDKGKVEVFMKSLLTDTERKMLTKRLMVGVLVWSGWSARAIADALKMSTATVYKLKECYELDGEYKRLIEEVFEKKVLYVKKKERKTGWFEELLTATYRAKYDWHGSMYFNE